MFNLKDKLQSTRNVFLKGYVVKNYSNSVIGVLQSINDVCQGQRGEGAEVKKPMILKFRLKGCSSQNKENSVKR